MKYQLESVPSRPLIGNLESISLLRAEYEKSAGFFVEQIDWLKKSGYGRVRRARGDGDCFYRSIAFAYIDQVIHASERPLAVATVLSKLEATLLLLEKVGFQSLVYEDFYIILTSLVNNVIQPDEMGMVVDSAVLLTALQTPEVSNSIVVFFRLVTSAQIRSHEDEFMPFLTDPELQELLPADKFCERFVETVGKDADHVQITALSQALGINIKIAYLDGHSNHDVGFLEFSGAEDPNAEQIVLLYRPGHYDILVKA